MVHIMGAKKVKTVVRQEQIKDATLGIIARRGLEAVTISTIARAVGITESNVYRHFKNKGAVIQAVAPEIGKVLRRIIRNALDRRQAPLITLRSIFSVHIGFLKTHKGLFGALFLNVLMSKETAGAFRLKNAVVMEYFGEIQRILRQGIGEGVIAEELDVDAAATAFLGLIQSMALQWVIFGRTFAPDKERCERIWKIYTHGILSRPPRS